MDETILYNLHNLLGDPADSYPVLHSQEFSAAEVQRMVAEAVVEGAIRMRKVANYLVEHYGFSEPTKVMAVDVRVEGPGMH